MRTIGNMLSAGQAIILGVVIVGCATAATITGHLSGADLLVVFGVATGAATGVTGAHVGATAAVNAAGQASPSPGPAATTGPVAPVVVAAPPQQVTA